MLTFVSLQLPSQPTNNIHTAGVSTLIASRTRRIVKAVLPSDGRHDGEGLGEDHSIRVRTRRGQFTHMETSTALTAFSRITSQVLSSVWLELCSRFVLATGISAAEITCDCLVLERAKQKRPDAVGASRTVIAHFAFSRQGRR